MDVQLLVADLLIVLTAGLLAGLLCKRLGISLLVGYLIIGAVIGHGALNLVTEQNHELELLAQTGALLLLFSIGIEFSIDEFARLRKSLLVGGFIQMSLVAVPVLLACRFLGMTWPAAILTGVAAALSSTVLVFKSLNEWGQAATRHGRRAISILLFQDIALVPIILLVPLLGNSEESPQLLDWLALVAKSFVFVVTVYLVRRYVNRTLVHQLSEYRSVELLVLFVLSLLGVSCWLAAALGLTPAIGALAAGLILSGNRLSPQIDTIVLPFRECFAAVFFVTLGTLFQPIALIDSPIEFLCCLLALLVLKSVAAAVALRCIGLSWRAALGMGIGLAQLGEFSFLVLAGGLKQSLVTQDDYNRMLFLALGSLVLTPFLLKRGLRLAQADQFEAETAGPNIERMPQKALIAGVGPIGRQLASRLEIMGIDVSLIDLSPVNLYPYAQQGFHTVAGDSRDKSILELANAQACELAIVSVPNDEGALRTVEALRSQNPSIRILVRCRFQSNVAAMNRAGATQVVCEELEVGGALLKHCESLLDSLN